MPRGREATSDPPPDSQSARFNTRVIVVYKTGNYVRLGSPNTGVFIFPDNQSAGTLETVLLECAGICYPRLLQGAQALVNALDLAELTDEDLDEFNKPAGKHKSIVGSVSSVLKPGKSVQVSIQDNRWVDRATVEKVENLRAFRQFLLKLLNLPAE